jgi:hypothetical protein
MNRIIKYFLLVIGTISFFSFGLRDREPGDNRIPPNPYPLTLGLNKNIDANTVCAIMYNDGRINYDIGRSLAGWHWPRESDQFVQNCGGKTAIFASGLWIGAVVGNDTLVSVNYHNNDFWPGFTDASGNPQGKDDGAFRIYKLVKGRPIFEGNDRAQWPNIRLGNSDQNAPVYFDSSGAVWKPLDLGSQTLFFSYTDSYYPQSHGSNPGRGSVAPLKADVNHTVFAFDVNGPLGQMVFHVIKITNKNSQPWTNAYLCMWSDDDLGDAGDDKSGVDTTFDARGQRRNLSFTYNGDNNDPVYGADPPAVGMAFFRGVIDSTGNPLDTAYVCEGTERVAKVGFRQRGMSSFNYFENNAGPQGDPRNFRESYNFMLGKRKDGTPVIDPNGDTTLFIFAGDPVRGTGWNMPDPGTDVRSMMNSGPFTLYPDITQTVVFANIIARRSGNNNLQNIDELRIYKDLSQKIYDLCFKVPVCASPPSISYYAPGNGKIFLTWDDADEKIIIKNELSGGKYYFQGYNVYQIKAGTNGTNKGDRKLLATFDIKDGITNIKDTIKDEYGETVVVVVQQGSDNGISRFIQLERDEFGQQPFINGTPYYFSVTAYHYDSTAGPWSATPLVCEGSVSGGMVRVIPQRLFQGSETYHNIGDTLVTNRRDLAVVPVVINPLALLSGAYTSTFVTVDNTLAWHLTGPGVDTTNKDFSGSQDTLKPTAGFLAIHHRLLDSGVVKDPTDPLAETRDIHTTNRGWSYEPPENRWVTGLSPSDISNMSGTIQGLFSGKQFDSRSMSISFPHTGNYKSQRTRITANGPYFSITPGGGSNPNLGGGPLRRVRLVFGQNQKAYRYVPPTFPNDTNFLNLPYVDYVDVPFSVYAVEPLDSSAGAPRQLNCAFVDADNNGIWDPDTTKFGKFQIVYIFVSTYDPNASVSYTSRNIGQGSPATGFPSFDIMYVWVPKKVKTGPQSYTNGDVLDIYPYIISREYFVPDKRVNYSWSVKGSIIGNSGLASQNNQMDKVKVFPNPYYGQSRLETNRVDRFVYFSNLPKECTIYIYTLNGVLVKKITRNVTDPRNSLEQWDLRNESDIPIASGMYIALVDAPGIGTKVLKLAIFTPQERVDQF